MAVTGTVFNIQRYSLYDGPGVRTTVFLKGCPARCWWCHNPESQLPPPEIACSQNRCIACDACLLACQNGIKPEASCTLCAACCDACPTGAREIVGREMTVGEVLTSVLRDRMFFEDSGGGVTFSGGEPLSQPEFLKELLVQCKRHEIHSAVDTAGLCSTEQLLAIAPLADLFLFDLKCLDAERHLSGTGIGNRAILGNLERLAGAHDNIWLRIPVVPGFNDSALEMQNMATLAAETPGVRQVWLLPYHAGWAAKPARFGKEEPAPMAQAKAPPRELLENFALLFRAKGLDTRIGGEK